METSVLKILKAYVVKLVFDMEHFDDDKLNITTVERIVKSQLGGEGIDVSVEYGGIMEVVEVEDCPSAECVHNYKGSCEIEPRFAVSGSKRVCLDYTTYTEVLEDR